MKCPVCTDVTLAISTREGIEIDHCPNCRGVWLDRGELDKLIERSAAYTAPAPASPPPPPPPPVREPAYREPGYPDRGYREPPYEDRSYRDPYYGKKRKKRSFLEDMFDFD